MHVEYHFHEQPRLEAVEQYAQLKIENLLQKLNRRPVALEISFHPDGSRTEVRLWLNAGLKDRVALRAYGDNHYEAVDRIIDKLRRTLLDIKEQRVRKEEPGFDRAARSEEQRRLDDAMHWYESSVDAEDILRLSGQVGRASAPNT